MTTTKPLLINNLEFATSQQLISENLNLSDLQRLTDLLAIKVNAKNPAKIAYKLQGATNKYSHPSLYLSVDAELPAICQRCLNEMSVQLKLNFDYLISHAEPDELDTNDDLDWLETNREMNVWELVEDELLIAFPIAPMHALNQQQECGQHEMQSGEKPNPFDVLKNFIKKTG